MLSSNLSDYELHHTLCSVASQLMPLLPTSQPPKLLLRRARNEPLQAIKHLLRILRIHNRSLGLSNQLLDAQQAIAIQVLAQPLIDLMQHPGTKLRIAALAGENLIDKARGLELVRGDAAAHEQGLVGLGIAEAQDQGARGAAFGDEADGAEGGEQKGRGRGVDEVGVGDEGGGEADDGAVEADDEDFGVRVKGLRDVEVEGDKGAQPELADVGGGVGVGARDGDVGATGME